jgi:prepilin-type N-terminal cleavage/methylation domain-containing protein
VGKLHPPGRNHIGKEMAMNAFTPIAQGHSTVVESLVGGARRRGAPRTLAFQSGTRSRGFTLIEMLVSLAITLIMMGAVVTLFGVISESVSGARSAIEMADRLRGAREQLQLDLQGVTATMTPPLRPEMDEGYFEIVEGSLNDLINGVDDTTITTDDYLKLFGDTDDVLMFTVRNRSAPFLGRAGGQVIESPIAEVVYFLSQNPNAPGPVIDAVSKTTPVRLYTLHRRVLLVSPGLAPVNSQPNFFVNNDVSVRYSNVGGTELLTANTLGDLTKRENRFAHYQSAPAANKVFPFLALRTPTSNLTGWAQHPTVNAFVGPMGYNPGVSLTPTDRLGDDILLTNVLSFDVRVWDPDAPLVFRSNMVLEPRDPDWANPVVTGDPIAARGAYVDLGYYNSPVNRAPLSPFDRVNPNAKFAGLNSPPTPNDDRIYDTWSLHYENDGIDQFGDASIDLGTNGLDDNANGIVDDNPSNNLNNGIDDNADGTIDDANEYTGEFETLPPYPAPLRGIKVTIRVYEPSSQTVREAVVIQNFDTK